MFVYIEEYSWLYVFVSLRKIFVLIIWAEIRSRIYLKSSANSKFIISNEPSEIYVDYT